MARQRIDSLLAERGLFASRTAAAESVRAGGVRIGRDGPIAVRPSQQIDLETELIVSERRPFVSRGGVKLDNALNTLGIDLDGLSCMDVGASTGGFTDCMLQRGAERVIALDVAYGQIDASLRQDERVTVIERRNARDMFPADLPYVPSLATIDVSFIAVGKILPAVATCIEPDGDILAMVKPQFELGRERVGRGGVVRSEADRRDALRMVAEGVGELGLGIQGIAPSGLPGPKGNVETFLWLRRGAEHTIDVETAIAEVEA